MQGEYRRWPRGVRARPSEEVAVTEVILGVMALVVISFLVGLATGRIRLQGCCGIPAERDARMRDAFTDPPYDWIQSPDHSDGREIV